MSCSISLLPRSWLERDREPRARPPFRPPKHGLGGSTPDIMRLDAVVIDDKVRAYRSSGLGQVLPPCRGRRSKALPISRISASRKTRGKNDIALVVKRFNLRFAQAKRWRIAATVTQSSSKRSTRDAPFMGPRGSYLRSRPGRLRSLQPARSRPRHCPIEARETLALIRSGGPFPYQKDGSFGIRQSRSAVAARAYASGYREYTVRTSGARDRGARRIIAGRARRSTTIRTITTVRSAGSSINGKAACSVWEGSRAFGRVSRVSRDGSARCNTRRKPRVSRIALSRACVTKASCLPELRATCAFLPGSAATGTRWRLPHGPVVARGRRSRPTVRRRIGPRRGDFGVLADVLSSRRALLGEARPDSFFVPFSSRPAALRLCARSREPGDSVSVLVVVAYAGARRAAARACIARPGFWQSVTGSLDRADEPLQDAAAARSARGNRDRAPSSMSTAWHGRQHRSRFMRAGGTGFAPGVTHNTEHVFGLRACGTRQPVRVSPG